MLVLALDTSTRIGSVAVVRDGEVVAAASGDATRLHAERLPTWLLEMLDTARVGLRDVDRLAVLSGPGGFTGLRVGLATVQGLAVGLDRPVVVASTLEALAWGAHLGRPSATLAGAWMRGMRGEIFTALYQPAAAETPTGLMPLLSPLVATPAEAAAQWASVVADGTTVAVAGDGWDSDGATLVAALPAGVATPVDSGPPAALLGRMACHLQARPVGPAAVLPTYIRWPDAVLTRQQAGQPVAGEP